MVPALSEPFPITGTGLSRMIIDSETSQSGGTQLNLGVPIPLILWERTRRQRQKCHEVCSVFGFREFSDEKGTAILR